MKKFLDFWKAVFAARDLAAGSIFLAVAAYSVILVALPFSSKVAGLALERFHLRLPYPQWAVLQLMPSMYSFENQVFVGDQVVWLDHHPLGGVYQPEGRASLYAFEDCVFFRFRSRYRSNELVSVYEVCPDPDGAVRVSLEPETSIVEPLP